MRTFFERASRRKIGTSHKKQWSNSIQYPMNIPWYSHAIPMLIPWYSHYLVGFQPCFTSRYARSASHRSTQLSRSNPSICWMQTFQLFSPQHSEGRIFLATKIWAWNQWKTHGKTRKTIENPGNSQLGRMTSHIRNGKLNKCLKPPTSHGVGGATR